MSLPPGTKLAHYEIVELIGKGGMGEVYRARDTKLARHVAIKVLPEKFACDEERMGRLEREARLLAQLNHANIATLHGLEEQGSQRFLVMELVEGETLAERIDKGPVPVEEALFLFGQIAEGLEVAHEKGVVHRDLKPANIKTRPEGTVKLLDFGLARIASTEVDDASAEASQLPTATKGTALGAILGTASYMSPEQARGRNVDRRADIWAFGCCLYEALTGKKTFGGATIADTIAKTLETDPNFDALPSSTPASIRVMLRRCLEKDARQRLRDIGDAQLEIRETLAQPQRFPPIATAAGDRPAVDRRTMVGIALAAAALASLIAWFVARMPTPPRQATRLTLELPEIAPPGPAKFGFSLFPVDLSPDGRRVVYVAGGKRGRELHLKTMEEFAPKPIPSTAGADTAFFSRDGRWIGFHADGELKRVALDGSQLRTVCDAPGFAGASWGSNDVIVFAGSGGLYTVPARGGEARLVVTPDPNRDEYLLGWPDVLPDGEHVLTTILMQGSIVDDPRARVYAVSLETGERRLIAEDASNPRYVPTGHIVIGSGSDLYALGFDADRLRPVGEPTPVLEGIRSDPFVGTDFAVADEGTLIYARAPALGSPARLFWCDREGRKEVIVDELGAFRFPRVSPDGRRLAVAVGSPGRSDIWIYDLHLDPPRARRLTSDGNNSVPIWKPDGERVIFASNRDGPRNLYWMAANGSSLSAERLLTSEWPQHPLFVTPDGEEVVLYQNHPERLFDIWAFGIDADQAAGRAVLETPFFEGQGTLSPDGEWLAYTSDRDGDGYQIYVQPFRATGGSVRISREGGSTEPAWSPDGGELYFTHDGNMMAVAIDDSGPEISYGSPEVLFGGFLQGGGPRSYDVAGDGRFVVIVADAGETPREDLVIVLDWFEELKRIVGRNN
jgi:serine/threonine-protein kinase